jgi:hypothetical protein
MKKRIGKEGLKAAPKPSADAVEKFARGGAVSAPSAEKAEQGVKLTIYLPPALEQRLREIHIRKPAPRGHFYGMLVELIEKGMQAS